MPNRRVPSGLVIGAWSLGTVSKIALDDPAAHSGHLEVVQGTMRRRQLLIPDLQAAGVADPGQRPLDHLPDAAKAAAVRGAGPRQVVLDPPPPQPAFVGGRAVGPVAVGVAGPVPRPAAAPPPDRRDRVDQRHRLGRVVPVRAGDLHRQRRALAVDQQVAFGALFRTVGGVLPRQRPPKTARTDWLSSTTFERSTPGPSSSTFWSIAASSFFQTPRRCQCRSRRQQVTPDPQPISGGSMFHGMPLWRTKTIPVSAARSAAGASLGGASLSGWLGRLAAAAPAGQRPKSCILLWMAGGPSHIDTFDPKVDAPENVRGEFGAIETSVPGIRISEHFP